MCMYTNKQHKLPELTLPVTITSKRIAYALWSVRKSVPFSVLKYLANLHSKRRKKKWPKIEDWMNENIESTSGRKLCLTTWSCSLWRRHSWQMVRQVAWKSTWVHNIQCSGPGYTSTQCLFLFLHPEREGLGKERHTLRLYTCKHLGNKRLTSPHFIHSCLLTVCKPCLSSGACYTPAEEVK